MTTDLGIVVCFHRCFRAELQISVLACSVDIKRGLFSKINMAVKHGSSFALSVTKGCVTTNIFEPDLMIIVTEVKCPLSGAKNKCHFLPNRHCFYS